MALAPAFPVTAPPAPRMATAPDTPAPAPYINEEHTAYYSAGRCPTCAAYHGTLPCHTR